MFSKSKDSTRLNEELVSFGEGNIKLSKQNLVYLEFRSTDPKILRVMTFGWFKAHIYYYSEFCAEPCVELLDSVEVWACFNAMNSRVANHNLLQ